MSTRKNDEGRGKFTFYCWVVASIGFPLVGLAWSISRLASHNAPSSERWMAGLFLVGSIVFVAWEIWSRRWTLRSIREDCERKNYRDIVIKTRKTHYAVQFSIGSVRMKAKCQALRGAQVKWLDHPIEVKSRKSRNSKESQQ